MNKAEAILRKHLGASYGYLEASYCEIHLPDLEEAMKEIASLAFYAGKKVGDYFPHIGEPPLSKEQFINNLFND